MESKVKIHSGLRKQERNQAYEKAPIAAIFEDCLQCFKRLCSIIEIDQEAERARCPLIQGSFSRFRQWGSDTGASSRSLDHALRKSKQLQQATKDLLRDLLSTLHATQDGLQDAARPPISPTTDYFNLQPEKGPSDHLTPSRASSDSDTSLQQLTDDIEECVGCLIKLVPVLRDPAPQDIYKEHASYSEANEDIELAKKMFPKATQSLVRRLGCANWKRRQDLVILKSRDVNKSLERSSNVIRQPKDYLQQPLNVNFRKSIDWTAAFSPYRTASTPGSPYTGAASIDDSIFSKSDDFSSRTATSVAGSDQMTRIKLFEVPKPPVMLKPGSTFDCAYCGQDIIFGLQVSSNEDWGFHVFLDLEPYMCTFDDCLRTDRTFGIREDWFQHELDHHRLRKIWFCCDHNFDEVEDIQLHIGEKHVKFGDSKELSLMASLCERYSGDEIRDQACPFCGSLSATAKALKEHVAEHMEQLALSSIQSVHGLDKDIDAFSLDDMSSDKKVKLEFLHNFVDEQRSYFWKPSQEPIEGGSAGSNVAFAEDSDDEVNNQNVHFSPMEPAAVNHSGRPPMKRRGDSWMTKINTFLDNQAVEQPSKEPWLSKVQTFLETQSVREEAPKENKADSYVVSPNHPELLSVEDSASTMRPHCLRTRPPPRDKDFVGRDSDLTRLCEILSRPGNSCVMSGAGGMGKTGTAIEYTYRYERAYSYIFWISAETAISCADTYSLIATEFIVSDDDFEYEQSRLITLGRDFLEQTEMRWLLIFDNVNSWSDIWQYIPTQLHRTSGSILITSRISDFVDPIAMPQCQYLELQALTLEESRLFLLNSMQSNSESKELSLHPEYKLAGVIAKEAGGLPLALHHIAGYVQVSECTLTDFVQLWNERQRHTKSSTPTVNSLMLSTDKTLEKIWNIGLREVTIDARDLLNILAFLDSDNIQRKLLVGEHEEPSLGFLHSDQAFRYKRMISELSRRNIISVKKQNDEETLSIHRSLQHKILQDLDKDTQEREKVFSQAFNLVRKRFPLPSPIQVPEPAKWPACKEYLPHVLHLENVITKITPSIIPSIKIARLLSDGGINLWERGMTSEGLRLMNAAEAVLDRLDSDNTLLRADIHVIINLLIQNYGFSHIAESLDRIQKALTIRLDYLKQTKPQSYTRNDDILLHNAWSDYGCVLLQYNKYEEAEPIFRKCLTKYLEWGSEEKFPYEYYKYNHHSAFCRLYHHDFTGAIELAEAGLHLITVATGQSSAASKTRFDLACIVLQSGDIQRALALHKEVLESNLRQHGKFNFLTLQSYYAVGALCAYSVTYFVTRKTTTEFNKLI